MENRKRIWSKVKGGAAYASLLLPFALLLFTSSCGSNRGGAVPASTTSGYCPVCRMKVNVSDNWAAEIYYNDGKKLMFESPGDMLAFYTSPNSYDAGDAHKDRANIERITVKDYQSKLTVDARDSKFVYKSKVEGPMGPDFLPFGKREDAEGFVGANGGTVLSLNEVTGDMARDVRK